MELAKILVVFIYIKAINSQQFSGCETAMYPPKERKVESYNIDLSMAPEDRWTVLMKDKGHLMISMVDEVKGLFEAIAGKTVYGIIYRNLPKIAKSLPSPYYEELVGVATASGLSLPLVTLYNIFYEAFPFCTSIVLQDSHGHLHHGRNLDNGAFMGWDNKNHTWRVTEMLVRLTVKLNWTKSDIPQFQSINFAGYIGILTALRPGKFSLSINKRIYPQQSFMGLLEWILFKNYNQKWVSFLAREMMETGSDYEEVSSHLMQDKLLAPVYFILGGVNPGEGCIITRDRENANSLSLNSSLNGQGSWYVVETNYDHWKTPPFYDNRRVPAEYCLEKGRKSDDSAAVLYNVLSTRPILNKGTAYTAIIDTHHGTLEAWLRTCPDPCWPW